MAGIELWKIKVNLMGKHWNALSLMHYFYIKLASFWICKKFIIYTYIYICICTHTYIKSGGYSNNIGFLIKMIRMSSNMLVNIESPRENFYFIFSHEIFEYGNAFYSVYPRTSSFKMCHVMINCLVLNQ